jgi:hypothetical protein
LEEGDAPRAATARLRGLRDHWSNSGICNIAGGRKLEREKQGSRPGTKRKSVGAPPRVGLPAKSFGPAKFSFEVEEIRRGEFTLDDSGEIESNEESESSRETCIV